MRIRIFKTSVVAAITLLLAAGSAVSQDNPTKPQAKVYSLCNGTCSRTMRVVATLTNVAAACEAAEKLRSDRAGDDRLRVGIFTGKADPWVFLPSHRVQLKPESCSVVLKTIRCGNWFIEGEPMDRKTAEAKVDELRKSGRSAEVIYHFSGE